MLGMEKKPSKPKRPLTWDKKQAAEYLGVTPTQFVTLAKREGLLHDEERKNGSYYAPTFLWSATKVRGLKRRASVLIYLEGSTKRSLKAQEAVLTRQRIADEIAFEKRRLAMIEKERRREVVLRMSGRNLFEKALECMHALNREAKHLRGCPMGGFTKDAIYLLKDRFLEALVLSRRGEVGFFTVRQMSREKTCTKCGNTWFGDDTCYECYRDTGRGVWEHVQWFLVSCGRYSFHSPGPNPTLYRYAHPIPSHDPSQPEKKIPTVGGYNLIFDSDQKFFCIERAIEEMLAPPERVAWVPSSLPEVLGLFALSQ